MERMKKEMDNRLNRKLNRRLNVMLFGIFILLLCFVVYYGASGCIKINQQNFSYIKSMAREEAVTVAAEFEDALKDIQGCAKVVGEGMDPTEYATFMPFDEVLYIEAGSAEAERLQDLDFIKLGMQGKSGIEIDFDKKICDEVTVVFYASVLRSDRVTGVLAGQLFQENISKLLRADCYDTPVRSFLTTSSGDIVFTTDAFEEYIGQNVFSEYYKDAKLISASIDQLENVTFEDLANAMYSKTDFGYTCKNDGSRETSYVISLMQNDFAIVETFPGSVSAAMINNQLGIAAAMAAILIIFMLFFALPLVRKYGRYQQMKLAATQAEAENIAKSEFLSKMSHDMRTPLNGILGMADIALRNPDDSARTEDCLEKIKSAGYYLLNLVNEVLDINTMEAGRTMLNETEVYLPDVLKEKKIMVGNLLAGKDLDISYENTLPQKYVIADPMALQKIALNLLSNAVKYTPAGGSIKVRCWEESFAESLESGQPVTNQKSAGDEKPAGFGADRGAAETSELAETGAVSAENRIWLYLSVEDTGIGMSRDFMKKMFSPYEREEDVRISKTQGTGLGLPIVKALVEMMHGKILVESEVGKGSKFTVKLPLKLAKESAAAKSAEPAMSLDELHLTGRRCLLVEDNELNLEIAKELLSLSGIEVETAEDGEKAVRMFCGSSERYYDIIFMDIQMPIMDGYSATKRIRGTNSTYARRIPIIAMTANAYESDVEKSLEAGMNAHLTKPIEQRRLAAILYEYLGE